MFCIRRPVTMLRPVRMAPAKTVGIQRLFSTSFVRMADPKGKEEEEEEKEPIPEVKPEDEYREPHRKHKPLSRMPLGSDEDYSKMTIKRSPVEFLTWKSVGLFVVVGVAMTWLFNHEKKKLQLRKEAEANRGMGKPLIGGPFDLVDQDGNEFTDKKLLGKFSVLYFGFTHCPDICPDELDELGEIIDGLKSKYNQEIQPIFITCDPPRDTPEVMKEYLKDFHPGIIGLTGTYENVKKCCRNYRVYFSTPKDVKPGQDYLVDHSIFFYLMDPEGNFIDVLGRNYDVAGAIKKIEEDIKAYQPKEEREKQKEGVLGWLYK